MIKLDDIRRHAASRPEATAVVDGDVRLSWERFAEAVDQTTAGLAAQLPTDRSARAVFLAGNRWEIAAVMAACATLGVSCTGLDAAEGVDALTQTLSQLQPAIIFVAGECRRVLDQCVWPTGAEALHVLLDGAPAAAPGQVRAHGISFAQLLETEPLGQLPPAQAYEGLTVVAGGEGPRVAVRRTAIEAQQLIHLVDEFGFDGSDVHLAAAPLWQFSAQILTRTLLALGGTIVLGPSARPEALAGLIVDERVTTAVLAPEALTGLLSHPASAGLAQRAKLRCVVTHGRHLGRWVINTAWERLGPVLHLAHETPETGLNMMLTPEESHVVPMRSGRPTLGNTLAVLDEDGGLLPAGETGRIAVAGHQLFDGYLDEEAAFTQLDLGDGRQRFFVTDDLGRFDKQGRLSVTGRSTGVRTVVRDSAVDAALFRLESDLLNLPCLRDTAVMRVDHPTLGDALVVPFIAVAVGREATGYEALTATCARRVPSLPAHVIAVDTIPYSPTGRIKAAELLNSVVPIITLNVQLEQAMQQEMSA